MSTQTPVLASALTDEVTAEAHVPHPLHGPNAAWPETNCALDVWIELLSVTGREPAAAASIAFAADFVGDHWVMLELGREDLRALYGIDVVEFGPWKATAEHLADHLPAGRLLTVESDAFYLPDTAGTDYRRAHVKTGIVVLALDRENRRMSYLHNAAFATLEGEDYAGALGAADSIAPRPYLEMIRFLAPPSDLREAALGRLRVHLSRRPSDDPVDRLDAHLATLTDELKAGGMERFHQLAFASVRQFGSTAQLAAGFLDWLAEPELGGARERLAEASTLATRAQFSLARVARGRSQIARGLLSEAGERWGRAVAEVAAWDAAR